MHEMSLCEGILHVLEEQAVTQRFNKVKAVYLEVGALAGVEVEALRFGFDVVMKTSIAEDARLEIINMPGQAWCMPCMQLVNIKQRFDACPLCGDHKLQVQGGEEMRIKELEVE